MNKKCRRCSKEIPEQAKFCAECGAKQSGPASALSLNGYAIIGLGAALLWIVGWNTQKSIAGEAPTKEFPAAATAVNDVELHALQQRAKQSPDDINVWRSLVEALVNKLSNEQNPKNEEIFDLIDALREILRIEPNDARALQAMAELSFRQKVYDKAAEYYARYLTQAPEDNAARARYGSVLTLLGKVAEAEKQLTQVLKTSPNDFMVNAYYALLLAQKGEISKAKKVAQAALANAPSEEAKKEFSGFLDRLESTPEGTKLMPAPEAETVTPLDGFFKANPVAGPKFVKSEYGKEGIIRVYFHDFPMSAMPPIAKEKFFGSIKAFVAKEISPVPKKMLFIDQASGAELDTLAFD